MHPVALIQSLPTRTRGETQQKQQPRARLKPKAVAEPERRHSRQTTLSCWREHRLTFGELLGNIFRNMKGGSNIIGCPMPLFSKLLWLSYFAGSVVSRRMQLLRLSSGGRGRGFHRAEVTKSLAVNDKCQLGIVNDEW